MIQFFRGPYASYVQNTHGNGIYFATDKGIIKMNGVDYTGPLKDSTAVKTITLNAAGDKFIITYLDNSASEIEAAKSEYESSIEDKTLTMPNAVGGIAKGTKLSDVEGKTFNAIIDDLLFPTVNPTFTAPTASISFKNYSSTQEVGAAGPTSSNFTTGYDAGKITLSGTKQANRGGSQNTANSFICVNGTATNKTLPTTVTLGDTTFKYRAAYAQGPQPKNNKGGNYSSPLSAGTVDSSAITLNGTYPWYASTVGVTASSPVAKQALVAWNATAGAMYTGDAGFTLEASGTVPQVIKVPNSRTISNMEMYDTGAEKWKAVSLSVFTTSTENITVNGSSVTYTVYTYNGAARGQVKLRIKF